MQIYGGWFWVVFVWRLFFWVLGLRVGLGFWFCRLLVLFNGLYCFCLVVVGFVWVCVVDGCFGWFSVDACLGLGLILVFLW